MGTQSRAGRLDKGAVVMSKDKSFKQYHEKKKSNEKQHKKKESNETQYRKTKKATKNNTRKGEQGKTTQKICDAK